MRCLKNEISSVFSRFLITVMVKVLN